MKKFFIILGAALLAISINAAPVTPFQKLGAKANLQAKAAPAMAQKLAKNAHADAVSAATPAIEIQEVNQVAYYANQVVFKADFSQSAYYWFTVTDAEGAVIAMGGFEKQYLDTIDHALGIYAFNTNWVLSYGMNYAYYESMIGQYDWITQAMVDNLKENWVNNVIKYDTDSHGDPLYCLKEGSYAFFVEGCADDDEGSTTEAEDYALFNVVWYDPQNVEVQLATGNNSASISWDMPANLPEGHQLYVAIYNELGDAILENIDMTSHELLPVENPLTIEVEEGHTYSVTLVILSAQFAELGVGAEKVFTVGTSNYLPQNLAAEVLAQYGDSVVFTWETAQDAAVYYVNIYYKSGDYLANYGFEEGDLLTYGMALEKELGIRLAPGTYTWSVQAYTSDGQYVYAASEEVAGAEFTAVDLGNPIITAIQVSIEQGDAKALLTLEVDDDWYLVDDMTFHISGDIEGDYRTENGVLELKDLEVGKAYSIRITVEDPAGNINRLASQVVEFTAGEAMGVENLAGAANAIKRIENGRLVIIRGEQRFSATGVRL